MTRCARSIVSALALCVAAIAGGCGGHESATTAVKEGQVPYTTALVFLATALACTDLGSEGARFTPLVVRGPDYATTIEPFDDCRKPRYAMWWSYGYSVPVPLSGQVRLTPGNQPTATLDAAKLQLNHAATIYYVNCPDYYADCGEGGQFQGRLSSIEYFKDEDVSDAPN
jgi:hypothetical protein